MNDVTKLSNPRRGLLHSHCKHEKGEIRGSKNSINMLAQCKKQLSFDEFFKFKREKEVRSKLLNERAANFTPFQTITSKGHSFFFRIPNRLIAPGSSEFWCPHLVQLWRAFSISHLMAADWGEMRHAWLPTGNMSSFYKAKGSPQMVASNKIFELFHVFRLRLDPSFLFLPFLENPSKRCRYLFHLTFIFVCRKLSGGRKWDLQDSYSSENSKNSCSSSILLSQRKNTWLSLKQ